ncbi:MAG: divalent metal cation transporter [Actinomycetota bacterium]|jgi:NRAMP (natural resistance-associated macrophage protein)-like metal ion transporter|nr:divalent metal cation transporter [Actinomycetota bacterium]
MAQKTLPSALPGADQAAVLDEAHVGDIRGALGTIRQQDTGARRGWGARLLTLAAIIGPGIIVMVGDNDAGGVATYSQAGQNYGYSLLWVLPLLIPVLVVNQEMVVRLGAVTGVGHARLIKERFGRFWGWFSVGDLFVLDFLTIVTEFIGVDLALGYFGISKYLSVPLAGGGLVAMTASGSFRRWERFMLVFVAANFLVIPLAIFSHPHGGPLLHGLVVPGIAGGATSTAVLLIISIVGTTVAPWQLFFQQSNIVDKRITPRWVNYERADTVLGSLVTVTGAVLMVVTCAAAFSGTRYHGGFVDAGTVATALGASLGHGAGALYALVLLNASIIGAAAVTLGTSYAFGDFFGAHHSLHRRFSEAKGFYASFAGLVAVAAGIVLIPGAPLGTITLAVQALAGVLLPSASVFLLLLCNDREVLGPWVNRPWLNAVASLIIGVLLVMSLILVVSTALPGVNVATLSAVLGVALAVALGAAGVYFGLRRPERAAPERAAPEGAAAVGAAAPPPPERATWRMKPLALLGRPPWSRSRVVVMWSLRSYLVVAVLLLIVKAVELGGKP